MWEFIESQFLNVYDSAGQQVSPGSTAAADWAAHRRLSLPNLNGANMDLVTFIHL